MEKKLPKGWVETELGIVALVSSGYGFPTKYQRYLDYPIPFYKVGDISENVKQGKVYLQKANNYINEEILKEINGKLCPSGSIVFAKIGEAIRLNRRGILSEDSVVDNNIMSITYLQYINNKYGFYYFQTLNLIELSAGNAIPSIRKSTIEEIPFPLPPLPEQERIVAKLDKLFTQHEKIKKALDRIPQLLKAFRQQVLTQAVTGEKIPLKDVGVWKGGGTPSKSNKVFWKNGDILWITAKDMKGMFLDDSIDKITLEGVEGSSANLIPKNSILIVTRSGILRRILPVSTNVKETTVNQDLKALIPYNGFNYKYLLYALNGKEEEIRNLCMKSGTTVESVEFDLLKNYMLQVPPLQEQQEIVRRVESLFAKADAIESRYQTLKAKIDSLPQAILHKAFKGELVPQLPTDGDAKDLLAEIMALKEEVKGRKKNR